MTSAQEGAVCIVTVDADLSGAHVAQFRSLVERALAKDGRDFAVDLGGVSTIDSGGLESLTWLKRECDEKLGMIKLCKLSPTLKKVLEVTRLDRQFEQYEQLDETLKSFA